MPTLLAVKNIDAVPLISRDPSVNQTLQSGDRAFKQKSLKAVLHPFASQREYARALVAVKLQKIFARPFIRAFPGSGSPVSLAPFRASQEKCGVLDSDGELKMIDMASGRNVWSVRAHERGSRTVSDRDGLGLYSCGVEGKVKYYWADQMGKRERQERENMNGNKFDESEGTKQKKKSKKRPFTQLSSSESSSTSARLPSGARYSETLTSDASFVIGPEQEWALDSPLFAVDAQWDSDCFAVASTCVTLFDKTHSSPLHAFQWGADSIKCVRFSPAETNLLASAGADRSIVLYDTRTSSALKKMILLMQTNEISFSPVDPFYFVTAGEDGKCYTFDTRRLEHALIIHDDHVSAVMSVHYSPTGAEFVTGSYDRTVRIYKSGVSSTATVSAGDSADSREIYHGKRMQRVFDVKFTNDAQYVLSASDDMNVRLWRANASQKPGIKNARERTAFAYREKLIERYQHAPEIRHIHRHHHLPKVIYNEKKRITEHLQSQRKKEERRRNHSKRETHRFVSVKKRVVRTSTH